MRLDSLLTSILPTPLTVSALLLCLASALGLGIFITAVFPVGCLMFLVAFLLIGCGIACLKRR